MARFDGEKAFFLFVKLLESWFFAFYDKKMHFDR